MDYVGALACLYSALAKRPSHLSARHLTATVLAEMGRKWEAEGISRQILTENPFDLTALQRLSSIGVRIAVPDLTAAQLFLTDSENPNDYLSVAKALNFSSDFAGAQSIAQEGLARWSEADEEMKGALLIETAYAVESLHDWEQAISIYDRVPAETKARARAASGHARCLLELGRLDEARQILATVGATLGGAIPYNLILQSIFYLTGDIRSAHAMYRHRKTSNDVATHFDMPDIVTRSIRDTSAGKSALMLAEGGPGDEIRFASMYREIATICHRLSVTCEPRLHTLLARSFPEIDFIPTKRHRKETMWDNLSDRAGVKSRALVSFVSDAAQEAGFAAESVFTTLDALSEFRAYPEQFANGARLVPSQALVDLWQSRTAGSSRRIGLAWRSMLQSHIRDRHYLRVDELKGLAQIDGAEFWVLQANVSPEEVEALKAVLPNVRLPENLDLIDDFEGQAAILSCMDAVISPLTTMAELSGMVGTPTFLLSTTHVSSWRKRPDGTDIWYPNSKLMTGEPIWDRTSLVEAVASHLQEAGVSYSPISEQIWA